MSPTSPSSHDHAVPSQHAREPPVDAHLSFVVMPVRAANMSKHEQVLMNFGFQPSQAYTVH